MRHVNKMGLYTDISIRWNYVVASICEEGYWLDLSSSIHSCRLLFVKSTSRKTVNDDDEPSKSRRNVSSKKFLNGNIWLKINTLTTSQQWTNSSLTVNDFRCWWKNWKLEIHQVRWQNLAKLFNLLCPQFTKNLLKLHSSFIFSAEISCLPSSNSSSSTAQTNKKFRRFAKFRVFQLSWEYFSLIFYHFSSSPSSSNWNYPMQSLWR